MLENTAFVYRDIRQLILLSKIKIFKIERPSITQTKYDRSNTPTSEQFILRPPYDHGLLSTLV